MKRFLLSSAAALDLALSLSACTDPYEPGQRAVGGAAIGAGSGAVIGGPAGGGRGALAGGLIGSVQRGRDRTVEARALQQQCGVGAQHTGVVAQAVKDGREPGSAGVQRAVGAEPFYFFWLMADEPGIDALPFVVVSIGFRHTAEGEQRSFAFVHGLVKPALECLRRELLARH